jgi:rod shape-determining protein MreB
MGKERQTPQAARPLMGRDVAIDLGTANTLVYARGEGLVCSEPSVVATDTETGAVVAAGTEAKRMLGRAPSHISVVRPLKDGVIADFDAAEKLLRYFIQHIHPRRMLPTNKPRVVVCVPSGVTGVEQRAVVEAAVEAGARKAYSVPEPMAAAIGEGLPIHDATGSMIVDIGGGTTEVAVIALGGIVSAASARVGGDELDEAIAAAMKKQHALLLGERTAEEIKMLVGSADRVEDEADAEVRGRDLVSGMPRTVTVSAAELREAVAEPIGDILDAIRDALDRCPPELAADVAESGLVLTGGGALLAGMGQRVADETGAEIRVAEDPLSSVVVGSGWCLEDFATFEQVLVSNPRR